MRIAITGAIFCICFFMPQQIAAAKLTINISNQEKPGVLFLTICNSAAGFENSVENESEEDSCRGAVVETELKDVFEIRELYPQHTQRQLAEMYGVGKACIKDVVTGRTWRTILPANPV